MYRCAVGVIAIIAFSLSGCGVADYKKPITELKRLFIYGLVLLNLFPRPERDDSYLIPPFKVIVLLF